MNIKELKEEVLNLMDECQEEYGADSVSFSVNETWDMDTGESTGNHDLTIGLHWEEVGHPPAIVNIASEFEDNYEGADVTFSYNGENSNVNVTWEEFDANDE